jgi:phosphomannomutase
MNLFRAYDLRGVYPDEINERIAERVGKALGTFLQGRETVCVGFDTRFSSKRISKSLSSGLISTGCDVISLGLVPSPIVYFHAWKNKTFGCAITASHNPQEWNGFKLIKPDGTSFVEDLEKLKNVFESENFLKGRGRIEEDKKVLEEYTRFLQKKFGILKGRIVIDFLGGAGVIAANVFEDIGLNIIPLHDKPDPSLYGFHRLEPWGKLLNTAKKKVKREKVDFGVAFDCDADRSVFISPTGEYVDGSVMNGIFIEHILKRKKGEIIATYDCATELEKFAKKFNGKFSWCRVGHGFIEKKRLEENALFAGEQSSHFYFNEFYPFSDGILTTLYLAKILNETGEKFNELINRIKFHPVEKIYINAGNDEKKIRVVEELKKDFPKAMDIMDGFKIKLNNVEWILIRSSQTLPEINICAEGKNKKRLNEIVKKYSRLISEKLRGLNG